VGHGRVKVAGAAGGQLNDRDAFGPDPFGIAFGFNITFDNTYAYFSLQCLDGVFQQGCFAGTGAADQVEGDCAYFIEMFPVGPGQGVVGGKQAGMYIHRFAVAVAVCLGVIMIVTMF
jgi:hypothetical protein